MFRVIFIVAVIYRVVTACPALAGRFMMVIALACNIAAAIKPPKAIHRDASCCLNRHGANVELRRIWYYFYVHHCRLLLLSPRCFNPVVLLKLVDT